MRTLSKIGIAAALGGMLATGLAAAQATAPNASRGADVGFFRPAADPTLTSWNMAPRPEPQAQPETQAQSQAAAPQTPQASAAEMARQVEAAEIQRLQLLRWNEEQMARAEREAERMREQAAQTPSVGAAFTGSTSERDR